MVKLNRNEIEKLIKEETGNVISDDRLLSGMSYSSKMLDINELFDRGGVSSASFIDLSNFPDVTVIQASSQKQLDMLLPKSKLQIQSIHLSNNIPVGWDGDFDMESNRIMDRVINLEDYKNFQEKHGLNFILLSDPEHILAETLGVWGEKSMYGKKYMGIIRSTFLINKTGDIVKEWKNVKVKGHVDDVLSVLEGEDK